MCEHACVCVCVCVSVCVHACLCVCVYVCYLAVAGKMLNCNGVAFHFVMHCTTYLHTICLTCIRLTADVQDFKSSFKMCVSIGLRSITQVVGGVVSLFMISPQMASVMALTLPLMIGIGSLMGSGLRVLSRKAQEQVCSGTTLSISWVDLCPHTCF